MNLLNKNHIISYSNYSKNLETNPKINKSSNDDFDMGGKSSKYITNKLLNWLISLNMIKEGTVKAIDIPRMCANGVFLSDLINRLEGVNLKFEKFNNKKIICLYLNYNFKQRDWNLLKVLSEKRRVDLTFK